MQNGSLNEFIGWPEVHFHQADKLSCFCEQHNCITTWKSFMSDESGKREGEKEGKHSLAPFSWRPLRQCSGRNCVTN